MMTLFIERHGTDLQGQGYYVTGAHKALQRDMPDAPSIQHGVIIPEPDFTPRPELRGVLV